MYCKNYGSEIPETAKFCPGCGTSAPIEEHPQTPATNALKKRKFFSGAKKKYIIAAAVILVVLITGIALFFTLALPKLKDNSFSKISKKEVVVEEIYKGKGYMTISEAKEYISGLLGAHADKYEVGVYDKLVRFSLKEDSRESDWLELKVAFSDGTSISLPCNYTDVKSVGWRSEDNERETWTPDCTFYCQNDAGWRIGFVREWDSNTNNISIIDSVIEGLNIACGDFAKKDNYVILSSRHPEFEYMGINRKSIPAEVIQSIALPETIEHNGVNMTFEYTSIDYSIKERTSVEVEWLTLKDGPEIMRDFRLRRRYMSMLLW